MVYDSGVLQEAVTVTGPVTADLWISLGTTDADVVVKLIDVFQTPFWQFQWRANGWVPDAGSGEIMRPLPQQPEKPSLCTGPTHP
ncbi:MAG: hypothetical protein IPL65_19260 [Lewinellaceae bacterium]|nr:hypothetical protein [Lewinellaceae bacterium]